ncbi:MAG TPA: ATP-binding protein [Kamptonema sp.]|nr:ATP-binding protein [Kamptonema sp.]
MDNNQLKILIIDDQPSNLRFLSKILTEQGYKVQRAISGQLGLNAAIASPPDLILLDIMMPDLDGYEVCKKLKSTQQNRAVPVIFLSSLDDVQDKIKAFQVGGIDYITKPFQVEEVLARIDTQIAIQKLQKQLEEQNILLQQSQSLLASILNSSLDRIEAFSAVRNSQKNIVDFQWILVNRSVEKNLDLNSEKLVGKYLLEEMPQYRKNGLFDLYVSVVETGVPLDTEFYYEQEKLSGSWLQIVAVKLNDGFAVTSRNITARKQAEQELARSNAELEQFAYVASHDLQAPLSTIASYAQLLEGRYTDQLDANAIKFIHKMIKGAMRMQSLIDDLLEYSRVSKKSKDFKLTDCNRVFAEACANLHLAIRKNQAAVSRSDLPAVIGDSSQLVQVFQNLIGNAIKYRCEDSPIVNISAEPRETDWLFSVRDNGIGIDSKHSERIFQIFQRLHTQEEYTGTGIGLAICQKIVERHGGRIWIESQLGVGSTFYFTLPYVKL